MKLFISDYDGTYLRPDKDRRSQIRENATAVLEWQLEGGLFGFSTGRILPLIELELEDQDVQPDFMIVANGSLVLNKRGEIIVQHVMDKPLVERLMAYLKQRESLNFICSDGQDGYHTEGVVTKSSMAATLLKLKEAGLFQLTLEESMLRGIAQISIIDLSSEEVERLVAELVELFEDELVIYPNRSSIDLSPLGTSKATGIKEVLDYFNLTEVDVVCMGDSWNDVEMIKSYRGFTVPEAPSVLRRLAKRLFSSVEEALTWVIKQKRLKK